jgi:hypothetical protein
MAENPEKAFSGNGKRYKYEARIVELERRKIHLGQCVGIIGKSS